MKFLRFRVVTVGALTAVGACACASGTGGVSGTGGASPATGGATSVARPQEVNLGKVTRVQISGIRLTDSPEEHIWVEGDTDVTITGITISTLAVSEKSPPKNTDGVDVTATPSIT